MFLAGGKKPGSEHFPDVHRTDWRSRGYLENRRARFFEVREAAAQRASDPPAEAVAFCHHLVFIPKRYQSRPVERHGGAVGQQV